MSKKSKTHQTKNNCNDYYKDLPNWYWKYGLHDTEVLNILTEELLADYNIKDPKYNRMDILLNGNGGLGEIDITKIILYNYKIISGNLPKCEQSNVWWISDNLSKISENSYKLELELADDIDKRYYSEIGFQNAEVIRK